MPATLTFGPEVQHFGAAVVDARLVVVALHGRDQDPAYMDQNVVRRVDDPSLAWLAPAAPGRSWYPKTILAPIEDNQPWLQRAEARLDQIETALRTADVGPERILWCGFSQGACLACHHLVRAPRRWAGLVAFTGGLIGPPGAAFRLNGDGDEGDHGAGDTGAGFGGMPVYLSTSDVDPWMPEERLHETAAALRAADARVTVDVVRGRGHEISDREIEGARPLFVAPR